MTAGSEPTPGEVRITSETGGEKGKKLAELGFLDPQALMTVAEVAGFGGQKYAPFNFVKGYDWSLSYNALQRHLHAFWNGEENDPESGLPHVAHAAWHCLALLTFSQRGRGTDDRINRFIEAQLIRLPADFRPEYEDDDPEPTPPGGASQPNLSIVRPDSYTRTFTINEFSIYRSQNPDDDDPLAVPA